MNYIMKSIIMIHMLLIINSEPCHAGFLDIAKSAISNIDTEKLKGFAEKGQSFLGSMGGGGGGLFGGGDEEEEEGASCPATCPAEQATLAQEIAGTESLIKQDENNLLKTGASFVTSQQGVGSPNSQSQNAAANSSQKQGIMQRLTSNKDTLKGLWGKLQGQTGKLGK